MKIKVKRSNSLKGKTFEEIYGKKRAKEIKEKRTGTLEDNPEIMKKRNERHKQTLKNNPGIMIRKNKKHLQTLKDNPDIVKNAIKKFKQTLKDNPDIMKNITKKVKHTLKDNSDIMKKRNKKNKQTLEDNPDIVKNIIKKRNQTYKDNPEIRENAIKKFKQTLKNNPNIMKQQSKKVSATLQGIELKDWKKFVSREPYSQNWNNKFKRLIRKRDNYICLKCGKHQEKEKHSLAVHHINYDKKLTIKENCCTICRKCNIEVNKNRKHWTKFFQSLLSEKYGYQYENGSIALNFERITQ